MTAWESNQRSLYYKFSALLLETLAAFNSLSINFFIYFFKWFFYLSFWLYLKLKKFGNLKILKNSNLCRIFFLPRYKNSRDTLDFLIFSSEWIFYHYFEISLNVTSIDYKIKKKLIHQIRGWEWFFFSCSTGIELAIFTLSVQCFIAWATRRSSVVNLFFKLIFNF